MDGGLRVVHVDDVPIERQEEREGWAISEFRLPVSGRDGSATAMFHSIFRPGSTHAKHVHEHSDEIAVYLRGHGVVGQGASRARVSAGDCRLIPRGSEHFFHNATDDDEAVVVGFYLRAGDVAASGYRFRGSVEDHDVAHPGGALAEGLLLRMDDAAPADTSAVAAWRDAEVRLPIGRDDGSDDGLVDLRLPAGASIPHYRFRRCEQLYVVADGTGTLSDGERRTAVRAGHVLFAPVGSRLGIDGTGSEGLRLVGVLTGAGSLEDTGCALD